MRAAHRFVSELRDSGLLAMTERVRTDLYGSLALTGKGHGTDRAVLLGLSGEEASSIDPAAVESKLEKIRSTASLSLLGSKHISFHEATDLLFHREIMFPPGSVTQHPNGVRFFAFDEQGEILREKVYFSIGGGFVVSDGEAAPTIDASAPTLLYLSPAPLSYSRLRRPTISPSPNSCSPMKARIAAPTKSALKSFRIWQVMQACVERGMATEGILPGGLSVRRRAKRLAERLAARESEGKVGDPLAPLDWVTVYAMAVNEENAAGGRVVTAPTNGAAGVVPAVAYYYRNFVAGSSSEADEGILRYFLTSAAIGILYKENASISGAEVGCQGEVGVACSMAARRVGRGDGRQQRRS